MSDLIATLKNKKGFISLKKPASSEIIVNAEKELELSFSKEYKDYVSAFGAASFVGHEITGVCTSKAYDVINITKQARELCPDIPLDRYVIEYSGVDNIYIWQDKKGYIYQNDKKIYNSFSEFIEAE